MCISGMTERSCRGIMGLSWNHYWGLRSEYVSQWGGSEKCLRLLLSSFGQHKQPRREEGGFMTAILYLCLLCVIHRDVMWLSITGGQWHWEQKVYTEGERVRRYDRRRKRSMVKKVNYYLCLNDCIPAFNDTQWHSATVISLWSCKSSFLCLFSLLIKRLLPSIQFAHKWNH